MNEAANADTRRNAFDHSECGNGPDNEGIWPCEPKVLFGTYLAECQACGRVAAWGRKLQLPACDRCSQGVMDATNSHLLGICDCECHA